jgi:hypothetical protein
MALVFFPMNDGASCYNFIDARILNPAHIEADNDRLLAEGQVLHPPHWGLHPSRPKPDGRIAARPPVGRFRLVPDSAPVSSGSRRSEVNSVVGSVRGKQREWSTLAVYFPNEEHNIGYPTRARL